MEARDRASQLLVENRDLLDKVAGALLEVETLQDPELTALLESDPGEPWQAPLPKPGAEAAPETAEGAPAAPAWPEPAPGVTT